MPTTFQPQARWRRTSAFPIMVERMWWKARCLAMLGEEKSMTAVRPAPPSEHPQRTPAPSRSVSTRAASAAGSAVKFTKGPEAAAETSPSRGVKAAAASCASWAGLLPFAFAAGNIPTA